MGLNRWLGCIENPRAGRESLPLPAGASVSKRVVVVGGGPGGLQAAVTAASRGHQVTLYERSDRLGGQVATAASVPSRAEFLDLTRNLIASAKRAGVRVVTSISVDAARLQAEAPDVVVLATGARPARPWWGQGHERVVDVRDVLEGRASPKGSVVIVDDLGFHQATSVAEWLADRQCAVEVITGAMVVGQDLGITLDLETWNVKAHAKGIRQRTDVVPMGLQADGDGKLTLVLQHHPTGREVRLECDWIVCAVQAEPEDELWHALKGAPFPVHRVGDCLTPRRAHAAVIDGERVGGAL